MARSVYVAGLGPGVGKGTVALGLVELLSRQVARIGVFRPLVSGTGDDDPLLELLTKRYPVTGSYGVTAAEAGTLVADGKWEELIARIVERYREVERLSASVVVIGSDFAVGPVDGPGEHLFVSALRDDMFVGTAGRGRLSLAGLVVGLRDQN